MVPGTNIYRGIIDAGAFHKAGRRQITTAKSSLVPAGMLLTTLECFVDHPEPTSKEISWEVDSRSVVNPATGGRMMCHRPRFDVWRIGFDLEVDDSVFDENLVRRLVDDMGSKIGLGDFRPARKGPYGRFKVVHWHKTP